MKIHYPEGWNFKIYNAADWNKFTLVYRTKLGRQMVETLAAPTAKDAVDFCVARHKGSFFEPHEILKVTEWVTKKKETDENGKIT